MSRFRARVRSTAASALAALLVAAPAFAEAPAAPAHKFAAPSSAPSVPGPAGGLAQVTLSLVLVLAAVFAAAWLLRRLRPGHARGEAGAISVVAEQAVGPRERVVLLQVGEERVLVGVASGSVRALHTLRGPVRTERNP